jgi:DnaJ-class molecular chaperone
MKVKLNSIGSFKDDDDEVFKDDFDFEPDSDLESIESQSIKGKLVTCKYCDGTGKTMNTKNIGMLEIGSKKSPCPACKGSGYQRV